MIFQHSKIEKAVGGTILAILILLAFLGNLLTCLIFLRKPRLRTPTNISVLFLAVSDILMAVLIMPSSLASLMKGQWPFSPEICTFNAFLMNVLLAVSLITMTCTAVIRYLCVVKPVLHHQFSKPKIVVAAILILWLICVFLTALPVFALSGRGVYVKRRTFCVYQTDMADIFNYIGGTTLVISGVLILVAYFKVFRFVCHHNQTVGSNLQQGSPSHVEEVKITKTLVIVVLGFVSCWAPATIIHLIFVFGVNHLYGKFTTPPYVSQLQTLCIFATTCINPLIYGFTNRRYRKEYLELLRLVLRLGTQVSPSE